VRNLLVIAFPSEQKAEEVGQRLHDLQKEYLIELGDAVIAVKDTPLDYEMAAKARAGLYRFPCIIIAHAMRASLLA
jgi:uncharacterized membrane protein